MSALPKGLKGATERTLRRLAKEVSEVAGTMDDGTCDCESCGHALWNDRDQYEIARSIRGIVGKLDKVADRIRGARIKRLRERADVTSPTTGA